MSYKNSRDDYWDIEKLVPKKRLNLRPFATHTSLCTHAPGSDSHIEDSPSRSDEDRKLSFATLTEDTETESYTLEDGLIKRVSITRTPDKYDFYDSFRRSALLYFDCPGNKCEYAEFYSYMPQYAHMTKAQQSYYLFWRSELRRGRYIRSDYSYIYLFVYEILNLPDKIPADEGVRLICRVWREYRSKLPRLDFTLSVWLQDYCLVHRLACPRDEIKDFISGCLKGNVIKEFYLSDFASLTDDNTELVVGLLSDYEWRSAKVLDGRADSNGIITGNDDYRHHMLSSVASVIRRLWDLSGDEDRLTTVTRSAFPNSLCTHMVKCKLTIEYISFAHSPEMRAELTSWVRYTENKLRHLLSVKSRLQVKNISDEARAIIDAYFESFFKREEQKRKALSRPQYERLYDMEHSDLSFSGADEIERTSWRTTERLVVEEDEITYVDTRGATHPGDFSSDNISPLPQGSAGYPETDPTIAPCDHTAERVEDKGSSSDEIEFLLAILSSGSECDMPKMAIQDRFAEEINEQFIESLGDIVLEFNQDTGKYQIIEDYIEEVKEWLNKNQK